MSAEGSSETRRLFIAVMPPTAIQQQLAGLIDLLAAHRAILRPARPEGLHVTLRFLGASTADEERRAAEACAEAAAEVESFQLVVGGFGVFPSARRPRVVWLDVRDGTAALVALHHRLEDELLRRGVIAAREAFTPHLTLARVRDDASPSARAALGLDVSRLPDEERARLTVDRVSLVHSTLTPRGSRYDVLRSAPIAPRHAECWRRVER